MHVRDELYIGGAWTASTGTGRIEVENPATEEVIGYVPDGTPEDMGRAVGAARAAFDRGPWPGTSPAERAGAIDAFAAALTARAGELTEVITAETGLPITVVGLAHVRPAIATLAYYAELARTTEFEEERPGARSPFRVRRLPAGVVAAIVPWNIPLLGACAKLGPALAAGCTAVLKPSPETPLSACLLADAAHEAGLPAGVLNVVPAGREAGAALVAHPGVDKVTFTGSTAAGKRIAAVCAERMTRYSLELGGNAACILLEDAPVERAAAGVAGMSLMNNNGEACIVQGRILVPRARHDEFTEALCAVAREIPLGDPADPRTLLGPMVSRAHLERVLGHIGTGTAEGARLACGGKRPEGLDRGWYVEPTVFAGADNGMRVVREEIFGPVVTVIPYDSEEEAVAIANDTEYGLSGSVWSRDPLRAAEVGARIRAGSIYVNGALRLDAAAPFGGFKESGIGREGGPEGLAEYLEPQVVFVPAPRGAK
ncbi:aldehyde dehydrogenase [Planomonospora venezuelensis]|uniref:Betaine-aldehyde dehydrogenase n=1 Tax=Planomonospora venezuelensis TaxID=1999 RepID=A0A841DIZ5_PLAVE|nr:betaine-aldehyde dehydrogenase [Planomonospora venezuelensis]GIN04847.1 putative aldehyde dehydrogenase [Planomonospora venezuelensis]